jgi:hypothetical protein
MQADTVTEILKTALHCVRYYEPPPHQTKTLNELRGALETALDQLQLPLLNNDPLAVPPMIQNQTRN